MKFKKLVTNISLSIAVLLSMQSYAEDIELYVNHNVKINEKPRVLIVFDTSGSMAFSTKTGNSCGYNYSSGKYTLCSDSRLGVAKNAISDLVDDNEDIDFGLMRFNGDNGGYVMARLGSSRKTVLDEVKKLPADGATPLAETLWEAYLYITGSSVYYGTNTNDRDFTAESGRIYKSPFEPVKGEPERCDNSVNIILMTDGDPSNDSNRNGDINNLHRYYFNNSNGPVVSGSYLAALAKVIHGTKDVKIDLYPNTPKVDDIGRVYAIGFGSGMSASGKDLLDQTAKLGGGEYLHADTSEQLSEALKNTITQIRSVNDTFTSPSLASNNVDQTRSRESIYYAMFYPESGARWRGNLKKLKVKGAEIVGLNNLPALNDDGLIDKSTKTFWLPSNEEADGNNVQRGGVNSHLSLLAQRTLYTDAGSSGLVEFNNNALTSALGSTLALANSFGISSTNISSTIDWARGIDVDDEDGDGSRRDQRKDIFGDPLHSKPVTVDYGDGDVRILIGTNAGFLHMFQDKDDKVNETWAFIPKSLYKIIDPLRNNQADTKVYGVDGPISVFFDDKDRDGKVNGSDRVWAFFGLRRGGNYYYGLDITNPNSPKLMWTIQGGTGDFKELAQTWSEPTVSFINLTGYKNKPVLIFGAGYDTNKDNVARTNDKKGRGIFIVDAQSGSVVWSLTPESGFKGEHSIAANISTLDSDYDGYVDRIYATDTGGAVWRVDMPSDNPNDNTNPWSHFKLADLGNSLATQDRRFFYKPMIARTMYSKVTNTTTNGKTVVTRQDTPFDAVLIGSGNRSKPTATSVQDQLFMIRDNNTVTKSFIDNAIPTAITANDLMNVDNDPFGNSLADIDKFTAQEVKLSNKRGWYYNLPATGEKSLAAPNVIGGVAYYTSYTPASATETVNQCSLSGGKGAMYAFHLHYGTKVYDQLSFTTSNDVPDTPQLYFGEGPSCVDKNNNGKCDAEPKNKDPDNPDNPDNPEDPDNPKDTEVDVKKQSQFLLIGPGIKKPICTDNCDENPGNPFKPKEVLGPGISFDKDGKIKLVSDAVPIGFGFKTQQTFIYKREVNDNHK
ncbi:pilin biogenesis protein [Pseudoalteromonas sp. SG41-2]|uniref:pilus assembly protein n=1 Tax=Pseudoalteromonas sp. SG41-2 TaxID=2760978 RepID=UPI0016036E30|nr:PilC/PilY family type IV pilus protein [Pseudoalteromonas sp. SG41-2]MBB1478345.1 pilin biogenesis protein [Pseudoalteromonas sp. SG41-2]